MGGASEKEKEDFQRFTTGAKVHMDSELLDDKGIHPSQILRNASRAEDDTLSMRLPAK